MEWFNTDCMYNGDWGRGFRILAGFGKKPADEKHVDLPTDKVASTLCSRLLREITYFFLISRIELRVKKAGGHRSREPSFGEVGLVVPDIVPGLSLSHRLVPHIELTSLHLSPLDRKLLWLWLWLGKKGNIISLSNLYLLIKVAGCQRKPHNFLACLKYDELAQK